LDSSYDVSRGESGQWRNMGDLSASPAKSQEENQLRELKWVSGKRKKKPSVAARRGVLQKSLEQYA